MDVYIIIVGIILIILSDHLYQNYNYHPHYPDDDDDDQGPCREAKRGNERGFWRCPGASAGCQVTGVIINHIYLKLYFVFVSEFVFCICIMYLYLILDFVFQQAVRLPALSSS